MPPSIQTVIITTLWLVALGGIFGSFMNVVVYRLPRRMSLSHPGSRCPRCGRPIRWYHNVPVLGWLVLRGRCRDCREPISVRYPLVEGAVAAMFLALGWIEFFSETANLPRRPGNEVILLGGLLAIYAFHLLLLCGLACAALIQFDGQTVPSRLWTFLLAMGFVLPLFWPELRPVPFLQPLPTGIDPSYWQAGLADGLFGLFAGLVLAIADALIMHWRLRRGVSRRDAAPRLAGGWICVGVFVGWQAVVGIGAATLALVIMGKLAGRLMKFLARVPPGGWLWLATFLWLALWQRIWLLCGFASG